MLSFGPSRRSVLAYFGLVFAFAIPFWLAGPLVAAPGGLPHGLPLSALQAVCPLAAACLLVRRESGARGVKRLLLRLVLYRGIRPIWYLPSLLLMPAIYLLAHVIQRL